MQVNVRTRYLLLAAISFVWLLKQLLFLYKFGVRAENDANRYLSAAKEIVSGVLPSGNSASYLGYDSFVSVFLALDLGTNSIAAAQILMAFSALLALYKLGSRLYDVRVGLTAAAVFVLFPDTNYWHAVIYTESLYSSMIIISIWLIVSASTPGRVIAAIIAFCFTCAIRPHGVGFAVSGIVFILCRLMAGQKYGILTVISLCILASAPLAWNVLGTMSGYGRLLDHYVEGTVIWGYPNTHIPAPSVVSVEKYTGDLHPLIGIAMYVVNNPVHFWTLAIGKVVYFLAHVRPYFAWYHNFSSLVFLIPAYLLGVWSLLRVAVTSRCTKLLLASTFTAQMAIVSITFADWDGRHLIPVLSILFLVAAAGLWDVIDRIKNSMQQSTPLQQSHIRDC